MKRTQTNKMIKWKTVFFFLAANMLTTFSINFFFRGDLFEPVLLSLLYFSVRLFHSNMFRL